MKKIGSLLALLTCLYSICPLQAQSLLMPAQKITSFPFRTVTGGVIMIKAQLAGHADTLQFILDTGSGGISVDSAKAEALKLPVTPSNRVIRGIAGMHTVSYVYAQKLLLPGLQVDSLDFHINNYEILTSAYGEQIDGIIGYAFLSRYIVTINYDSSRIDVFTQGHFPYPKGGLLLKPSVVNIPFIPLSLKDARKVRSQFYFDTGAGMCLLLSSNFVRDSMLLRPRRKWYVTQAEGLGGKAQMQQGILRWVQIGPYRFRRVPTYIFDDVFNVTYYPQLGGLIGNDLLRRFNLILQYHKKEIYLLPNGHFRDAFDYSYTGLGMYWVDGLIRIEDVMPGSPAAAAGLQVGDIVLSINNDFSQHLQRYKEMLQEPGRRYKIMVMRADGPVIKTLKVGHLR